jgi:hypothetical protein
MKEFQSCVASLSSANSNRACTKANLFGADESEVVPEWTAERFAL